MESGELDYALVEFLYLVCLYEEVTREHWDFLVYPLSLDPVLLDYLRIEDICVEFFVDLLCYLFFGFTFSAC